jgi:hypothetical protein
MKAFAPKKASPEALAAAPPATVCESSYEVILDVSRGMKVIEHRIFADGKKETLVRYRRWKQGQYDETEGSLEGLPEGLLQTYFGGWNRGPAPAIRPANAV